MLKTIRQLFGYTQKELAIKIEKTQNYYTLIESGVCKSAPTVGKIGEFLEVSPGFLLGDSNSYPFTGDFYVFTLREETHSAYSTIINELLLKTRYMDVVIFERVTTESLGRKLVPVCIALKDDHGTIILITRRAKRKTFPIDGRPTKKIETESLPGLNIFRQKLYEKTWVYERTLTIEDFLYQKIRKAVDRIVINEETPETHRVSEEATPDIEPVSRGDIDRFFPSLDFFRELFERHRS